MKLNPLFCDKAVLQCDRPVRVFGAGSGRVSVTFLNETKTVISAGETWCIMLSPHPAGGPYEMEINLDGQIVCLHDLMLGYVFLCAGQSNMKLKMDETSDQFQYEDNSMLRLFTVPRPLLMDTVEYFPQSWVCCEADTGICWSAIPYHFGQMIQKTKNTAIGIISCCKGASVIQSWMDETLLHTSPFVIPDEDRHCDLKLFSAWNPDGYLYHSMFRTVAPYSMCCVIWYQGESNTSPAEAAIYDKLLALLISNWRRDLVDETLPFILVQIHSYAHGAAGWKKLQDAQRKAADAIPNVIFVQNDDLGEPDRIHPVYKLPISRRIARAVRTLI